MQQDFSGNSEFQRDSSDADGKEPRSIDGNSTSNAASRNLDAPGPSSLVRHKATNYYIGAIRRELLRTVMILLCCFFGGGIV
jgi:hypothetical protein